MRGVPAWVILVGVGCTDGDALDGDGHTHDPSDCPSAEDFVVGMQKTTPAGVLVTLAEASPAPPYRGPNTWTITLAYSGGAPLAGATPVLTPWMPLHNHGLVPAEYPGTGAAGSYTIAPFDLTMPGQWEFTVDVGAGDSVTYVFCVGG